MSRKAGTEVGLRGGRLGAVPGILPATRHRHLPRPKEHHLQLRSYSAGGSGIEDVAPDTALLNVRAVVNGPSKLAELCRLAGIKPTTNGETGEEEPWLLKDMRRTWAYRHYAHRAPLAFKAILTLPQPSAFSALLRGFEGECPCCRRTVADALG